MYKKNVMFYPPKKTFDQPNSPGKRAKFLCDPLDRNHSPIEHLHKFSCQFVRSTIGQPPCIWTIFPTTYMKNNSPKSRVCHNFKLNG